eukprot:CAMPEP_0181458774 /NCGR_PEP_ID=MMETSP1110-20121109/32483_1 /TAXON_ID=174948 /ORGANISM="Symbiodinium sp., Strain CCMP421" /LENGTH=160 /DNA_ID=CAMNT_0023583273 /DNA_START=1 /DNA_END=484 /DNA_ORIENTATION=+
MYYYIVPGGQAQQMQGGEGMMANQQHQMQGYDQMQGFNMGGDHGGYVLMPQDGGVNHQMGQMQPTMMAAGNNGCMQQMVLVTMMTDQQGGQQTVMMDPSAAKVARAARAARARATLGLHGLFAVFFLALGFLSGAFARLPASLEEGHHRIPHRATLRAQP